MNRLPRLSPWGAIQKYEVMSDGVFQVSTHRHSGIMVRKNAADFLSPEARKSADSKGNYLCYEEDAGACIVIRELLDKKMWQIPNRFSNKAQYEDTINESLQKCYPEYWEARQKRLAIQAYQPQNALPQSKAQQSKPSTLAGRLEAYKAKAAAHSIECKTLDTPHKDRGDAVV